MNRNLFLLAAALQLPVALWMQGCGKDEETSDDEHNDPAQGSKEDPSGPEHKDPATATTGTTVASQAQTRNRTPNATIKELLANDKVKFDKEGDYYRLDALKATAHVQVVDSEKNAAKDNKSNGFHLLAYEYDEFFSQKWEWKHPEHMKPPRNRLFPGIFVEESYLGEETVPVVLNADVMSQKSSAASVVIAHDVTPKDFKKESTYMLVTEVYARSEGSYKYMYPAGNPAHLMNVFMPSIDVCDFAYDFAFEAVQHILLFNTMMTSTVDPKLDDLHKEMKDRKVDQLNVWMDVEEFHERGKDKEIKYNEDVQSPYPGTKVHTVESLAREWRSMNEFVVNYKRNVEIVAGANRFPHRNRPENKGFWNTEKNPIAEDTHRKDPLDPNSPVTIAKGEELPKDFTARATLEAQGKWGQYEPWDHKNKKHADLLFAATLHAHRELQQDLVKFADGLNHVFLNNDFKMPEYTEDEAKAMIAAADGPVVEKRENEKFTWKLVTTWNGNSFDTKPEAKQDFEVVDFHGYALWLPDFIWERIVTHKLDVIPKDEKADWELFFEEATTERDTLPCLKPDLEGKVTLDSYIIEEIVLHNPAFDEESSELTIAIVLGMYDAWTQAGDEKTRRRRSHYEYYILGDSSRHHRRNNEDRRGGGVRRYAADFDIEVHWPKLFTLHDSKDLTSVDFKTLLEQKSNETVVAEVAAPKGEKKTNNLKPVNVHESKMRNLATDN